MIFGPRPGWSIAVMVALAVCLPGLAMLQYRWIGQLSQAEQQRMQSSLRVATARFSRDLDSGVTRVYMVLQGSRGPDRESNRDPAPPEYAKRWMEWSATSADRNLVRGFYLARPRADGALDLARLNRLTGQFEPVDWPAALSRLRARLESPRPRSPMLASAIDEEIPAVVAPSWRFPSTPPPGRPPGQPPSGGGFFRRPAITGWAIAELDLEWIEKHWLPELVERYFAGANGLDYQVAIVDRRDPQKLIYTSNPNLSAGYFSSPDATAGLLN
ncbi:MAG: hypothetical protein ACREH9_06090, partial [Pseudomonadota bacterium]